MIRKATKTALGIPEKASRAPLLKLGLHNMWEELAEAHKASQIERLKLISTGRIGLLRLVYVLEGTASSDGKSRLPTHIRDLISVARVPRNMHTNLHKGRRQARAKAIPKKFSEDPNARYTDAAKYPRIPAFAITAINTQGEEKTAAMIVARDSDTAEEFPTALAISTCAENAIILSDSQSSCRNFRKGMISTKAVKILEEISQRAEVPETSVVCGPGHE